MPVLKIEFFCFCVFIVFKSVNCKFSQFFRYFLKKFDLVCQFLQSISLEIPSSAALLLWGIHKISNFVQLSTHILQIFSANSCKLVLFVSFLVITEVAGLSVFKCTEVLCNKGAKYFNAYFSANNSLHVNDSKRSFVVRFLWQVCVPASFSKIAPIAQLLESKTMTLLGKS